MSATRRDFVEQFPEFEEVDGRLLDRTLAAALLEIDADVWDTLADQGQMYLAAHKLALSPMGNAAKMVAGDGQTTTYLTHYFSLVRKVACGIRYT